MRKLSFTHAIYVLLLAIFMAGCNPGATSYTIVAPTNGSVLTEVPASFVIRYNAKPASADVRLNGVSVQRHFEFGDTEAIASGANLAGYLVQGRNTFSVDAKNFGPTISFTLDTEGPKVTVMSVSTTEPKEVTGLVTDASAVTGLSVNGVSVNVGADGTFMAVVSTANEYVFRATDSLSHESVLRIVPEGRQFNPLIKAAVNETAVQSIAPLIKDRVLDADLKPLLAELNPVLDITWKGLFGEPYGMKADVDDATLQSVTLNSFEILPSNDGSLSVDADIYDIAAHLDLTVFNGFIPAYHILGWFYVDHARFVGTVRVSAENGQVKIQLPQINLQLDGLALDIQGIPSFIEHLINPLIEALADLLIGQMSGLISGLIEDILADKINEMIVKTNIKINPTPVEGDEIEMGLDTKVERITTLNSSLVVTLSGGMTAISGDEGVAPTLGSVYDTGAVPEPALDQGNITAVVSSNLINQAMMVAYKVGLTHFWIYNKVLRFGSTPDDSVGTTGKTRMRIVPTNPAAFRISGNDTIVSTLELNAFDIYLDKKLSSGWAPQFQLNMDTALNVELGVDGSNRLTIGLVGTPRFHVNFVENYTALPLDEAQLTQTINTVLPFLVPALGNAMAAIEIPSFGGIQLLPVSLSAVGPKNQHLSFSGNLAATPAP